MKMGGFSRWSKRGLALLTLLEATSEGDAAETAAEEPAKAEDL